MATKIGSLERSIGSDALDDELKRRNFEQEIKHRNILVYWVIGVVSIWLIIVLIILFKQGSFSLTLSESFNLSDKVIMTLLGTTTVNILGLPYIILKGLFKSDKDKE